MPSVTLEHFERAALDIGAHGDNDTLPFDIDNRFIKDKQSELAQVANHFFCDIDVKSIKDAGKTIDALHIQNERLLVPTGPAGFRITTKIHPFWNVYFNGLGVGIAEINEPNRSDHAHSYRFIEGEEGLFNRDRSWRAYREATLNDPALQEDGAMVVQTDVSSFYEHIYHHRLENCIKDLFPNNSTIAKQIDRLLHHFSSGRSFGLPVGGQCARILAELLMTSIDQMLTDNGLVWHRYVDDYTLISPSQEEAYGALSTLSHALADYGLSLNRSKTTIMSAKHYTDYVSAQLGTTDEEGKALREIDLHFDPYSDAADSNYSDLKETVQSVDVQLLLNMELKKAQPDTFLVAQVGRTLRFQSPRIAIQLCATLLSPKNLHAFRASWSTIMRGVAVIRGEEENNTIFDDIDDMLDEVPSHSPHLLKAEASRLHYLRTIRYKRTGARAQFVLETFENTSSKTLKRACIDCWRTWNDRPSFIRLRNQWQSLSVQEQRMFWLASYNFTDDGRHARSQLSATLSQGWALGIEQSTAQNFCDIYVDWAQNGI